jgi:hypothetical protein
VNDANCGLGVLGEVFGPFNRIEPTFSRWPDVSPDQSVSLGNAVGMVRRAFGGGRDMPDRRMPRWSDATAAAGNVGVTEAAFLLRVSAGVFAQPSWSAGTQTPSWDRPALDAAFEGGADYARSVDPERLASAAIVHLSERKYNP